MGHNDHIDYELLDILDWACDEGYLDMENAAYAAAQKVAHELALDPAEQELFDKFIVPLYAKHEEWERDQYLGHLMSKDD